MRGACAIIMLRGVYIKACAHGRAPQYDDDMVSIATCRTRTESQKGTLIQRLYYYYYERRART